jgi:hypothetical protein
MRDHRSGRGASARRFTFGYPVLHTPPPRHRRFASAGKSRSPREETLVSGRANLPHIASAQHQKLPRILKEL